MTQPGARLLCDVVEATWPAATRVRLGPWTLRDGKGGGKRVSATTADGPVTASDLAAAEAAIRDRGEPPLFWIRDGEEALDRLLAEAGYTVIDPVTLYSVPVAQLSADPAPRLLVFPVTEPLAVMREIWEQGGIGPARLAVMDRVSVLKTNIIARVGERSVGAGFAAIANGIAMVHALEVLPDGRRCGAGRNMMQRLARWAAEQGAHEIALAVTDANVPANALYRSLGMREAGRYHYRIARDGAAE